MYWAGMVSPAACWKDSVNGWYWDAAAWTGGNTEALGMSDGGATCRTPATELP